MDEDIKNKKLSKEAYDALREHLLSTPGGGLAAGKDDQGMYSLDPKNMSLEDMEKARDFLSQKDATGNLLGLARKDAGVDPVKAEEDARFIQETQQGRPEVGGNALDLLREQNGFPASYQNRGIINRFQKPTKEEKKEINKTAKEANENVRTPAGEEQETRAIEQAKPEIDSNAILSRLMGTQNENNLIADTLRGTERINSALNLVHPDYTGAEALKANAGRGVENFEKLQHGIKTGLELNKFKGELADKKALDDPNSQISALARNTMRSLGVNVPDHVSAGILKTAGVNVGSLLGIKEQAEGRKDVAKMYAQQKNEAREDAKDQKATKIATVSDKQTDALSGMDKAISHIKNIIAQKPNFPTGPGADIKNKAQHVFGIDDAQTSGFRSAVGEQLASYIKSISGSAVSEPEAQRLIQNLPTMYDNDEVFTVKANRILKDLENDKSIYLTSLKGQGKNVAGFEPKADRTPSTENSHPKDKEAIEWAKANISKPENAQEALTILKANGIL